MADQTRLEYVGGESVTIAAPPEIVEENLIRASADGTYCRLLTTEQAEIRVNPTAVRALAAKPEYGSASF